MGYGRYIDKGVVQYTQNACEGAQEVMQRCIFGLSFLNGGTFFLMVVGDGVEPSKAELADLQSVFVKFI